MPSLAALTPRRAPQRPCRLDILVYAVLCLAVAVRHTCGEGEGRTRHPDEVAAAVRFRVPHVVAGCATELDVTAVGLVHGVTYRLAVSVARVGDVVHGHATSIAWSSEAATASGDAHVLTQTLPPLSSGPHTVRATLLDAGAGEEEEAVLASIVKRLDVRESLKGGDDRHRRSTFRAAIDSAEQLTGAMDGWAVWHKGELLYHDHSFYKPSLLFSMSKSFLMLAFAVRGGILGSCTEKTRFCHVVPELCCVRWKTATLEDFLSMRSGYVAASNLFAGAPQPDEYDPFRADCNENRVPGVTDARFEYADYAADVLSLAMTRCAGLDLADYLHQEVFKWLDVGPWTFHAVGTVDLIRARAQQGEQVSGEHMHLGNVTRTLLSKETNRIVSGSIGVEMAPAGIGKIGLLLLNQGIWHGRKLLDGKYLDRKLLVAHESGEPGYGPMTWTNHLGRWGRAIPRGTLSFAGWGHKRLFVVPELNLTIVRSGLVPKDHGSGWENGHWVYGMPWSAVLDRLVAAAAETDASAQLQQLTCDACVSDESTEVSSYMSSAGFTAGTISNACKAGLTVSDLKDMTLDELRNFLKNDRGALPQNFS